MSRFKKSAAGAAALALGASLFTLSAPAANSAPQEPENTIVGKQDSAAAPTAVTLINGDTIMVSVDAAGTPSAILPSTRDYYTRIVDKDLYVFPADAQSLLKNGTLDPQLFNVTSLIRQGYDDANSKTLPLIMQGRTTVLARSTGVEVTADLESLDATAVNISKDSAAKSYQQLLGSKARSAKTVTKIWLDARFTPTETELDPATGVEQAGAKEAWDLGFDGQGTKVAVLDTGFDAKHPDLAKQVAQSKDFTGEGVQDTQGHGTHVASTIAGSGAADAAKVGMAPKSQLLVGKVLGTHGGQSSWIIEGMEWAIDQGADVVSMSLGSEQPTDCKDPMSLATEELTKQNKTLFVIAAGNSGARETVSSPGCVEDVLTVGAVDSSGAPADFSSHGATLEGHNLKPDLAAPGVAIAGAATGTGGYVKMSGTSMATPHVAGAAALLAQAHPDYTAQQLKAALVSSVKEDAQGDVYTEGSGELWTPAAINTTLTSDVSVELGQLEWPHTKKQSSTEKVTYTNSSDKPVKLNLQLEDLTGADGKKVPSSLIKLGAKQITVPANGTASVDVTASGDVKNLRDDAYGEIGARITATAVDSEASAVTSVGFWLAPEMVDLTIKSIDRNGEPATNGMLDITDMHQPARALNYLDGQDLKLRVRTGDYLLSSFISTEGKDGERSFAYVGKPEQSITKDTTVVLDARETSKISVEADRPTQLRSGSLAVDRSWDERWRIASAVYSRDVDALYASPTDKVKNGEFAFGSYLRAGDPEVPVNESGYVYNLAYVENDRVSKDQSHQAPDSALGAVDENWYAQKGKPWRAEEWTRVVPQEDGTTPLFTSSSSPISTPATRTSYYSADVRWQQLTQSGPVFQFPDIWLDSVKSYEAGSTSSTEFFKLPTHTGMAFDDEGATARVAERQGSLIGFSFPQWKDSVVGRNAIAGFADLGKMDIYENDKLIGESSVAGGQARLSTQNPEIRVEVDQQRTRRDSYWDLGLRTRTSFTFDSPASADSQEVLALPVAIPLIDAEVDSYNRAPNEKDFAVDVSLLGQEGYDPKGITSLKAQVNYDVHAPLDETKPQDFSWTDAEVVQKDGAYQVLVDNTLASNGFVTLRLQIEDGTGSKIDQTIEHLYSVAK